MDDQTPGTPNPDSPEAAPALPDSKIGQTVVFPPSARSEAGKAIQESLRQNKQLFQFTTVDHQAVQVVATLRGDRLSYQKPPGFNTRKLCGAHGGTNGVEFCTNPAAECQVHCGAWTHRCGRACATKPVLGRNRCRLHGGNTPMGPASPHWKHGHQSRHYGYEGVLKGRLRDRFLAMNDHPSLFSLQEDCKIARLRIEDALERIGTGETAKSWLELRKVFAKLRDAMRTGKDDVMADALVELERLIQHGASVYEAWHEADRAQQSLAKLIGAEAQRQIRQEVTMSMIEVMALVRRVQDIMTSRVQDKSVLQAITLDLSRMLESPIARN